MSMEKSQMVIASVWLWPSSQLPDEYFMDSPSFICLICEHAYFETHLSVQWSLSRYFSAVNVDHPEWQHSKNSHKCQLETKHCLVFHFLLPHIKTMLVTSYWGFTVLEFWHLRAVYWKSITIVITDRKGKFYIVNFVSQIPLSVFLFVISDSSEAGSPAKKLKTEEKSASWEPVIISLFHCIIQNQSSQFYWS